MTDLNVYWDSSLVGHLSSTTSRDMSFQYAGSYLTSGFARQISLSMPLQEAPFTGIIPKAWFANLLPEGEIRGHVARELGVSARNEFAMLKGIGGDCAGALRLLSETAPHEDDGRLIPLPWPELEATILSTPRPSLMALVIRDGDLRLSLAGAQDKLPVHYSEGELALPSGGAASTHLLKISSGGFPDLVQNELFCLTLARAVGLTVPHAEPAPTRTPILLIERYDRVLDMDGTVTRRHQEDFCQASGLPPEVKYENEGGPSLADLFKILARGSVSPLPDKRDFLTWVIFNFIIGNTDAHAKNISFMLGGTDDDMEPRLAPFYDLVCTAVYKSLSRKQAQPIGGEYRPLFIRRRHWDRLAASIDVKPGYLRTVGLGLCDKVEERATRLAAEIGDTCSGIETLGAITRVIEERIGRFRAASCE
ncbi:type II toxin-antitoxin system HipA family toxin [bacterium]|nr:type II toxin-antitoxin system HipA family toxin [bacterium]